MIKRNLLLSKDEKKVKYACRFLEKKDFITFSEKNNLINSGEADSYIWFEMFNGVHSKPAVYLNNFRNLVCISKSNLPDINLGTNYYIAIKND